MKIFIQGRKDGYNTLYPKPTPREFYQFASDIQRIDAQNNAQFYGKSLYAIAFNGSGCIFTKYIIGYDTLRSYLGNIGISIFLPSNEKMLGADIKSLLDELINIYTTNYCPDFKFNNQKQEDWLLFSSYADNFFDSKYRTISSDENFQYGNKDAAYIFYNNNDEIEKYLESPYQEEYKEYKQILFVDNQSQLLLELIKHDQKANLTQTVDLKNPKYKLIYHQVSEGGLKIDVKVNGSTRHSKSKVKRKDILTISWEKPYHQKIEKIGKWEEIGMEFLKIDDYEETIEVLEKSLELIERKVNIEITDIKGNTINSAEIICVNNLSKENKKDENSLIVFKGEQIKDQWIISAKKDNFIGEVKFIPEHESIVKLVLRETKLITLKVFDETGFELTKYCKVIPFYDDEISNLQSIRIPVPNYVTKTEEFTPKNVHIAISVRLEKKLTEKELDLNGNKKSKVKNIFIIYLSLIALFIFCITCIGYYFYDDIFGNQDSSYALQNNTTKVEELTKLNGIEIKKYVEGDSLILENLKQFKTDWENQTPVIETVTSNDSNRTSQKQDSTEFKNWKKIDESLVRAINKRIAINEGDFGFFKDNNNKINFSEAQRTFKIAVSKIDENDYKQVSNELGDVSQLTLKQIADSIYKIIATISNTITNKTIDEKPKIEKQKLNKTTTNNSNTEKELQNSNLSNIETEIIKYLNGSELKFNQLNEYTNNATSSKLKKSINLALEFWALDGSKNTYNSFKENVLKDPNFKDSELLKFLKRNNSNTKYPSKVAGAKTKTLIKFIDEATK